MLDRLSTSGISEDPQQITLQPDQLLFKQGDEAGSMYRLVSGRLGVRVKQPDGQEVLIDELEAGAMVGEMAILSGQSRTATVYAIDEATLIQVTREQYERLSPEERRALLEMDTTVVARWQRLRLSEVLSTLYSELPVDALHAIQQKLVWHHLSRGDVLFEQGDTADSLYIVVGGRLRFTMRAADGTVIGEGDVHVGETVGEMGLLMQAPRTATVFAVRETNVVKLEAEAFDQLSQQYPALMRTIVQMIVTRNQRRANQKGESMERVTLAIIPASAEVDVQTFADQLATAVSSYGKTLALNSTQFDEQYGKEGMSQTAADDPANSAVVAWMGELEAQHNYLLFTADATWSAWTQRCISQADQVLVIANAQGSPEPVGTEQSVMNLPFAPRVDLVLWHSAETEWAKGTRNWLEKRPELHAHHHIRQGDEKHFHRLARRLTGNAIGLVFSGGGALGYAHLGIYRALNELEIPVDYVAGTSMGSIIAAIVAREMTFDEIAVFADRMGTMGVMDITIPFAALTSSKNVSTVVEAVFGGYQIEDLWTPYFCVSANLSTAEPVIHQQGILWRALRASISIPGVFVPVIEDGNVLVDGGIIDNFPVELMAEFSESPHLIGVHINPYKERKRKYDYDMSISGWRILLNRLNPFSKRLKVPNTVVTLIQAMEINGIRLSREQEQMVDLLITPNVKKFKITDYEKWAELADAGYEVAYDQLKAWKADKKQLF